MYVFIKVEALGWLHLQQGKLFNQLIAENDSYNYILLPK
jgi:hypothetical protein